MLSRKKSKNVLRKCFIVVFYFHLYQRIKDFFFWNIVMIHYVLFCKVTLTVCIISKSISMSPYKLKILGTTNIPLKKSDTDNIGSVQTIQIIK